MSDSTVHINVKWMEEAGLLEAGEKKPYRTGKQTAKYRLTLLGILFYLGFWVFVNRRELSPKEAVREVIENYPVKHLLFKHYPELEEVLGENLFGLLEEAAQATINPSHSVVWETLPMVASQNTIINLSRLSKVPKTKIARIFAFSFLTLLARDRFINLETLKPLPEIYHLIEPYYENWKILGKRLDKIMNKIAAQQIT